MNRQLNNDFDLLYNKYVSKNNTPYLNWENIQKISDDKFIHYNSLIDCNTDLSSKVAILKLNGGLGTSMKCNGPKSLMVAKDKYTFLDIIINNSILNNYLLILMNSFNTHEQTINYISKNYTHHLDNILMFNQSVHPRILKSNNLPLEMNHVNNCTPPGHGDILLSLYRSNVLTKLKSMNIEYIFISNADNLCGTYDNKLFNDIYNSNVDFAIELTRKTENDKKGGILIHYNNVDTMFEIAQCEPSTINKFMDINEFKYFNTNNIWIKVDSIIQFIESNENCNEFLNHIDLIINYKNLSNGEPCIQLEYALGGLVKFFTNTKYYIVNRDRFAPIKTNDNLFELNSDKFNIDIEKWIIYK